MRRYRFDFSKTTWTEIVQARAGTLEDLLALYDRIVVGGIRHLPMNEVAYVVAPQFKQHFDWWMERGQVGDMMPPPPGVFDTPRIDDDAVRGMLDDVEGL